MHSKEYILKDSVLNLLYHHSQAGTYSCIFKKPFNMPLCQLRLVNAVYSENNGYCGQVLIAAHSSLESGFLDTIIGTRYPIMVHQRLSTYIEMLAKGPWTGMANSYKKYYPSQ